VNDLSELGATLNNTLEKAYLDRYTDGCFTEHDFFISPGILFTPIIIAKVLSQNMIHKGRFRLSPPFCFHFGE